MKVAFVIGALRAKNTYEQLTNIREAEKIAVSLWQAGFAVICPHLNTVWFHGICPEENFLKGYHEILKRCDFAVILDNYKSSEGSNAEIKLCNENDITCYAAHDIILIKEREGRN